MPTPSTPPAVRAILAMGPAGKSYMTSLADGVMMAHYEGTNLTETNGKWDVIELVNLCGGDEDAVKLVARVFGKKVKSIEHHLSPPESRESKQQVQHRVLMLEDQLQQQQQWIDAAAARARTLEEQLQQQQQQNAAALARERSLKKELLKTKFHVAAKNAKLVARGAREHLLQKKFWVEKFRVAAKDAALKARTRMLEDQVYKGKHRVAVENAALVALTGIDRFGAAVRELELADLQHHIAADTATLNEIQRNKRTEKRRLDFYKDEVAKVLRHLSERQSTLEKISSAFEDDLVPQRLVQFINDLVRQLLNNMDEWEGIKLLHQLLEWHSKELFVQFIEDLKRGDARIGLYFELFEFVTDKDGLKSELQVHFASLLGFIQPGGQSSEATQQLLESLKHPSMEWDEDATRPLYKQLLGQFFDLVAEEKEEEVEDEEEQEEQEEVEDEEEQGESAEGSHVAERDDADVQEEEGGNGE